jgi:hypothetical protein
MVKTSANVKQLYTDRMNCVFAASKLGIKDCVPAYLELNRV